MVSKTRIVVLIDNEPGEGLKSDWGLSLYVETPGWSMIFDADTSPNTLQFNAEKLNLNLEEVSFAVLSHYHYDHAGGLSYIAKINPNLKIYVPPGPAGRLRRIGLNPIVVNQNIAISDDSFIIGPLSAGWGLNEISFAFYSGRKGLTLLVGCSHPGVDKIALELVNFTKIDKIHMIIGGYHSSALEAIDRLAEITRYFCPIHCSSESIKRYLEKKYPEKYFKARTGTEIDV